ncbi:ferrous iron transport protein A [Cyanobium sp. HWJ4-Hawea]|uniref:FeoA family protein n=1 Tax=unclassified Cyanobium TaxID=2627006 RepID=UPI0020CEAAB3|nr:MULTISPECIES: FeoA family protein [unclassified Cyanobium]MCP9774957.1 ferrous iron transport protein A [Cyanobium sp. WAJ14-Wanaka]MCP9808814.1 ferrous iron transport protein A [Cyanobium sp. HWJ4-Hawea]
MRKQAHLADLAPGHSATINAIEATAGLRHRLEAMGLSQGKQVLMLRRGWWSGPLHVRVGMTELMLRRRDAACVGLEPQPALP